MSCDNEWCGVNVIVVDPSYKDLIGKNASVIATEIDEGQLYLLLDVGESGTWIAAEYVKKV